MKRYERELLPHAVDPSSVFLRWFVLSLSGSDFEKFGPNGRLTDSAPLAKLNEDVLHAYGMGVSKGLQGNLANS